MAVMQDAGRDKMSCAGGEAEEALNASAGGCAYAAAAEALSKTSGRDREGYALEAAALNAGYGGTVVAEDISISIPRGKIAAVLGPNGAGKSTLLKTIAGLLKPVSGKIFINTEELEKLGRRKLSREMSVVLTERPEAKLMTVREVVSMGRYPYTGHLGLLSENDENAVAAALEITDTKDMAEREFSILSDGQKQRVLLAKAVCQEPEVMVLDEPVTFLDVRYKYEFMSILKTLAAEKGMSVIMTLHDPELAVRAADMLICMKAGKVTGIGSPAELMTTEFKKQLYDIPDRLDSWL